MGKPASKGRILLVTAHPDDETFGTGGTISLYTQRGVEVTLVCGTRGEAGEVDPTYLEGFKSVAARRETELRQAASVLGISSVILLDYRDSGMPGAVDNQHPLALINIPVEVLAQKIVEIIRLVRPHIVITFDPMGGYGHPDHIHIHSAVRSAFYSSSEPGFSGSSLPPYTPQKLFYNTISRRILRLLVRIMPLIGKDPRHFGKNGDIDLAAIAKVDYPIHARINFSSVIHQRTKASYCYVSQGGRKQNQGAAGLLRGWSRNTEYYLQAFPAPSPDYSTEDLLDGVDCER